MLAPVLVLIVIPGFATVRFRRGLVAAITLVFATACQGGHNAVFSQLTEARRLAADLRVQFNKASDASNRAVMADSDEAAATFAREAEQIKELVKAEVAALAAPLQRVGDPPEIRSFKEFEKHFAEYREVDRAILEFAAENTNRRAQRISFGPAREAADAFRDSLASVAADPASATVRCQIESLVARALVAVREIQVLHAPHIAESDDALMTRMEKEMAALETTARDAVDALPRLVSAKARPGVVAAGAALDRFEGLSREIVKLSRRNSNVRSLELSLRRKVAVSAACDQSLRALHEALDNPLSVGTR